MQTTKLLLVIGLGATLVALALTSGAGDTEAQIKAREALRQKMSELDTPSATAPTPEAPEPRPAPAKPAKPATPTPPAAPPQAVVPVAAPQKKAPVVPVAPVPAPAPVPAAAPALAVTIPSTPKFGPVPDAVENENTARAREALRQQMAALEFAPVPDAVENANTSLAREAMRQEMALLQSAPTVPTKSGRSTGFATPVVSAPLVMEVPLSPLTGSKAARLAQLLQRYNADQITPKEYHTQRAAIIAEP